MDVPPAVQWLAVLGVPLLSAFGVWHVDYRGLYRSAKGWQVTILTFHLSVAVVLRIAAQAAAFGWDRAEVGPFCSSELGLAWAVLALGLRWRSLRSPFSLGVAVVDVAAALLPLRRRVIGCIIALNLVIPPVFWLAMVVVVLFCPLRVTFAKLDVHLRQGLEHVRESREAHYHLAANVLLHGLQQGAVVMALGGPRLASGAHDVILGLGCYWVLVGLMAAAAGCGRPYPLPFAVGLVPFAAYLAAMAAWRAPAA